MYSDYTQQIPQYNPPPKKKNHFRRHLFLYFFLFMQAVFLAWVIAGAAGTSGSGAEAHAQAVRDCAGNGWQGLYSSYSDCVAKLGDTYNAASDTGKGIGAGLVIALWAAFDIVTLLIRLVVLLSRRGKKN